MGSVSNEELVPTCPVHNEPLRIEWVQGKTGFCLKCLKHYDLCMATQHMASCCKLRGHDGPHVGKHRQEWK